MKKTIIYTAFWLATAGIALTSVKIYSVVFWTNSPATNYRRRGIQPMDYYP